MEKYELLPQQLLHEGTIEPSDLFRPDRLSDEAITSVHTPEYWGKLQGLQLDRQEERRTGFPLSRGLVEREVTIMQGTVSSAEQAIEIGIAMNIAGGTHHAFSNRGEGFCLLNDIALGADNLLQKELARQVLVVDLDVHQGNGTAEIFQNDDRVFTFSMHGEKNFPLHKQRSDLDIALSDGTNDTPYLHRLRETLPRLFEKVRPDFIFYQCGVDVLASDQLGRLSLSIDGCRERDRIVLETCLQNNTPVQCSMGGGYSDQIRDIIEAHANTYRLARELFF